MPVWPIQGTFKPGCLIQEIEKRDTDCLFTCCLYSLVYQVPNMVAGRSYNYYTVNTTDCMRNTVPGTVFKALGMCHSSWWPWRNVQSDSAAMLYSSRHHTVPVLLVQEVV